MHECVAENCIISGVRNRRDLGAKKFAPMQTRFSFFVFRLGCPSHTLVPAARWALRVGNTARATT